MIKRRNISNWHESKWLIFYSVSLIGQVSIERKMILNLVIIKTRRRYKKLEQDICVWRCEIIHLFVNIWAWYSWQFLKLLPLLKLRIAALLGLPNMWQGSSTFCQEENFVLSCALDRGLKSLTTFVLCF